MRNSTQQTALELLRQARQRLELEDMTENDVEQAINKIEDAKAKLEEALE